MVCHSNHAVHYPSTAILAGPKAVCSGCHDAGTAPAGAATQMAGWLDGLDTALKKSKTVLASAEQSRMEVSEAQVHLIDGRETLVKARLALHSMKPAEMQKPVEAGTFGAPRPSPPDAGGAAPHREARGSSAPP